MINPKIFKAYDVRGIYPGEIDEMAAEKIAQALAKHFLAKSVTVRAGSRQGGKKRKAKSVILVGRDGRLSSPKLYKTVLKILHATRYTLKPVAVGLITTPMLYFLVNKLKADGGIMVTASHNPKEYNGLKVVGPKAVPISGVDIHKLIDLHLIFD